MTEDELQANCEGEAIDWAPGVQAGDAGYWLHWAPRGFPDTGECSFVTLAALPGLDWAQVRRHVVNGRNVRQQTRVVGYMSNVRNWNPSKIGELKGRHGGDYGVGRPGQWAEAEGVEGT